MEETHCDVKVKGVKPAKYSPEDKYGKYRREVLGPERKEQGLL
jgi:rRNA maturation protein Nop10|tara:strand:+ start:145 stop:273 length:129 start_codon:yes stop_codon:yes gene_type:complete